VTVIKRILVAAAAALLAAPAALAADIAPVVVPAPPVVVVPAPVPVFDWSGVYAGTRGAYFVCDGPCWINADGHAGYNFTAGRFLAGVELSAGYWNNFGASGWLAGFTARTGVVFGRVLAYAKAGFTVYGPLPVDDWFALGGGIEVGLGHAVSVFTGFTAERSIDPDGIFFMGVEAGVNVHFGN